MSLTLKVISSQNQSLGANSLKVFNEQGGSIGRIQENDWVLPDPDRFVSSRHVVIAYKEGRYFLQDVSANGVYINNWEQPIDRDNPVQLKDRDVIAIGNYEVEVLVTEPIPSQLKETDPLALLGGLTADPPDPFAQPAEVYPPLVPEPPPSPPKATQSPRPAIPPGVDALGAREHVREVLDPLELMDREASQVQPSSMNGPIGDDFLGSAPIQQPTAPDNLAATNHYFAAPKAEAGQIPEDWENIPVLSAPAVPPIERRSPQPMSERRAFQQQRGVGARPHPQPLPQHRRAPPDDQPIPTRRRHMPPAAGDAVPQAPEAAPDLHLLRSFMHGAGIEVDDITPEEAVELMKLLGVVFRQVVRDVREVLLARANLKAGFRMEMTMIKALENNPLKFSAGGVEDTLLNLLLKKGSGYLPPEEAFREGFQDIKDHQVAMMAGMRAAFENLLQRINPDRLESLVNRKSSGLFHNKKADYWDAFRAMYKEVLREAEDDFQFLFGKEFAEAYEEQIQILLQARGQSVR